MAAELAAGRTPEDAFATTAALLQPHIAQQLLTVRASPTAGRRDQARKVPPAMPAAPVTGRRPTASTKVIEHLEELSGREDGAEGLRLLAACWRIGAERGGALATVLDGLATALRDEEAQRQEIATQLAGPRATARLLAGLPLLGLGMAAALGANPLAFLFGTLPGLGCLSAGVGLDLAGLWWTRRLAHAAEGPG
ncbi:type II secretion system F family protein [Actinomadura viridis]|uniref:Tight adherence protein B n=1 Tax=Actinomadura viridis TaxID=58110 RepID=A0A931DJN9_9ACTN|nr:type II secretion system F family protein [Actinomadura viridis]MBG6092429.1 tight adherence protein B [Actinomadura viridis]